ncbi:MAG TPA: acetyltransferase [Longimicrobiaceae bacterium]|nr:acetyltransferase [Longimicrobiaceae bacterium]
MAPRPERFLVWGAGGHGRVVADVVRALGGRVAGYVDADAARLGQVVDAGGGRVVSTQDGLLRTIRAGGGYPEGIDAVALAIGSNAARHDCLQQLRGLSAPPLVHLSAVVSPSAAIGPATVVLPRVVINAGAQVGAAVILNTGAIVEHDCVIGDAAHVSPGAVLAGGVRVGERSWVGAGAVVIQGVTIGDDVVVGAGAVVIRDVPDGQTVVGNPARPIRRRGTE